MPAAAAATLPARRGAKQARVATLHHHPHPHPTPNQVRSRLESLRFIVNQEDAQTLQATPAAPYP
eukprot:scaffold103824_cov39-Phaeocystis_antarctica.AAC.2